MAHKRKTLCLDPRSAFFDERAEAWEQHCYSETSKIQLAELVKSFHLSAVRNILDLGAGTGVLAPFLRSSVGPEARILSFDISLAMLRYAAKKEGYLPGGIVQATALSLPLRSASVDVVVCFAAFPHFSDKCKAVKEIARVLPVGGKMIIGHLFSRQELARHHRKHSAVAKDVLPDDDTLSILCRQAGFAEPQITDIPGRYLALAIKEM